MANWWLVVVEPTIRQLHVIKKVTVAKSLALKLEFTLLKGTHNFKLCVICDSYLGADHDIALDEDITEATYLCIDVSRQTWNEFYTLDEVYCRNLLQLLQPTTTVESVGTLEEPSEAQADTHININDALQVIEIPDFHDFRPTPAYESCLPLDINRHIGDDPEAMGYFPFVDDPSFDLERYAHEYKYDFAWMSDSNLDPELELLVLEAARRLHINHGLSIAQIDDTGILVHALQPTQPQYAKFGMLLKATQSSGPEAHTRTLVKLW
ncbi:hypothetical protein ONZ45_g18778 [Pleurotus djamor]|nr:hypothetical protein ONZ45_g18778 [Pleurotus djamor]